MKVSLLFRYRAHHRDYTLVLWAEDVIVPSIDGLALFLIWLELLRIQPVGRSTQAPNVD